MNANTPARNAAHRLKKTRALCAAACIALLSLSGCQHPHGAGKNATENLRKKSVINQDILVDREKFVHENQERHEYNAAGGPALPPKGHTDEEIALRLQYNTRINREDPFEYTKLYRQADKARFPLDVNIQNMDMETFISMISELSGTNILVAEEVKGNVTAALDGVPWDQALESVLALKGLAKHVEKDSGIIRIHQQATIAQLEGFERQARTREQQALKLARASEPLYTEVFKLFYTEPEDVKAIIEDVIGDDKGESGVRDTSAQITVDERRNLLLVKARRDDLDLVKRLIEEVDSRTSQVFIEAFIVEVTEDFAHELGVRLNTDANSNFQDGSATLLRTVPIQGR